MKSPFGVIGLGRMAQALLLPLLTSKEIAAEEIFAVVGQPESVSNVKREFPKGLNIVSSEDPLASEVWQAPVQLLAIKPQQLDNVASQAQAALLKKSTQPVLISIVAGVTLKRLQKLFPEHVCVRAVPNTPVLVGEGLTGLAWGEGVSQDQKGWVKNVFSSISRIYELKEDCLDAFLALTSSGPAYVALMVEALADGAVAAGLSRDLALQLANRTLLGTTSLLIEKELHPGQLKDMVASPGGTTISALRHLEMAGIRSALIEAVIIAAQRSRELA